MNLELAGPFLAVLGLVLTVGGVVWPYLRGQVVKASLAAMQAAGASQQNRITNLEADLQSTREALADARREIATLRGIIKEALGEHRLPPQP